LLERAQCNTNPDCFKLTARWQRCVCGEGWRGHHHHFHCFFSSHRVRGCREESHLRAKIPECSDGAMRWCGLRLMILIPNSCFVTTCCHSCQLSACSQVSAGGLSACGRSALDFAEDVEHYDGANVEEADDHDGGGAEFPAGGVFVVRGDLIALRFGSALAARQGGTLACGLGTGCGGEAGAFLCGLSGVHFCRISAIGWLCKV
jgi:hypothetical protein